MVETCGGPSCRFKVVELRLTAFNRFKPPDTLFAIGMNRDIFYYYLEMREVEKEPRQAITGRRDACGRMSKAPGFD